MIYKTYICNKGISTIRAFSLICSREVVSGFAGVNAPESVSPVRLPEAVSSTRKEGGRDWFRYFLALSQIISHH